MSAPIQLYAIARFSKWLQARQLGLHQVDEDMVARFLKRDPGIVLGGECAALLRLLAMLRAVGVTVVQTPQPRNSRQRFLDEYQRHLLHGRGLAEAITLYYIQFAEQFVGPVRPGGPEFRGTKGHGRHALYSRPRPVGQRA